MRLILSLVVAVVLVLGVTYYRYGVVYDQDSAAIRVATEDCFRARGGSLVSTGTGSYTSNPMYLDCQETARASYPANDMARDFPRTWLWGLIAGLLGGIVTFMIMGRRASRPATGAPANPQS